MKTRILVCLGMLAAKTSLAWDNEMTRHYKVLRNTPEAVAVTLNPAAYDVKLIRKGRPSKGAVIAFSGNYNWLNRAIGYFIEAGNELPSITKYNDIRPILYRDSTGFHIVGEKTLSGKMTPSRFDGKKDLGKFAVQAGPRLIINSAVSVRSEAEKFRDDAVRTTDQVAVGVTAAGKLVVLFSRSWSLGSMAEYLQQHGCVSAMKMDGGHAAFMGFYPDDKHQGHNAIELGNAGAIPCGMELVRKS